MAVISYTVFQEKHSIVVKYCLISIILGRHILELCWLKMMLKIPISPCFCLYTTWEIKKHTFNTFLAPFNNSFVNNTSVNTFSLLKSEGFQFF